MIVQAQNLEALEGTAIVLSLVSLFISLVGFFTSLKFYRLGIDLPRATNEKTEFIRTRVGTLFDKTLNAAIEKKETGRLEHKHGNGFLPALFASPSRFLLAKSLVPH